MYTEPLEFIYFIQISMFWFQGIAPKLEFSTKAVIKETRAPILDSYQDSLLIKKWDLDVSILKILE